MTEAWSPMPSPATARRNRRVLVGFFAFFLVAAIGTLIFGFQVVAGIKERARVSDAALRSAAWELLVVADSTGGFPTSSAGPEAGKASPRLDGTDTQELDGVLSSPEAAWPVGLQSALAEFEPVGVETVREIVQVSWPPEPGLPPVLSVGGRPCGLVDGEPTLEVVNRWLRAAAAELDSAT